jgi:hypothetical protein
MTQQRNSDPRRPWHAAVLGLALFATGCGSFVAPFEGVPRKPPGNVIEAGQRIAICYNALFTTPSQVRKQAAEACGESTEPSLAAQDIRGMCPLMTPVRANFVCMPD